MKEIGFMNYPGRSYGRGSLVNFKISDSMLNAKLNKKKNKENSQNKRKSLIKVNE